MKTIATMIAGMASAMQLGLEAEQSWTKVTVYAPPVECCTTDWLSNDECNALQNAIDAAAPYTTLQLEDGVYCNKNYHKAGKNEPWDFKHQALAKILTTSHLKIEPLDADTRPLLKISGWSGIQIKNVEDITVKGLEIAGPALDIDGEQASAEHTRLTGRDDDWACGQNTSKSACNSASECKWSSMLEYCIGKTWSYYNGKGIEMNSVENVTIRDNIVHHTTSSGIRCDKCNDVTIAQNLVYGTVWWTTTGASAIVFAEAQGTGTNSINSNVVYGNRNCLPFFLTQDLAHFGAGVENYGEYNQPRIVDGSGVYITRNLDFEGTFNLKNNIAYDNGINGVVVHKTTNEKVTVNVTNNRVFDNGVTTKESENEGRQDAGGLTINAGHEVSNVLLKNNKVTAEQDGDKTYQCFGECNLTAGSGNNYACGGAPSTKLGNGGWKDSDDECASQKELNDSIRDSYPESFVPRGTQFTPWL